MADRLNKLGLSIYRSPSPDSSISSDASPPSSSKTNLPSLIAIEPTLTEAAQVFTVFLKLPVELQEMIFESLIAVLGPRLIKVKITSAFWMTGLETVGGFPVEFLANKLSQRVYLRVSDAFNGNIPTVHPRRGIRYRTQIDTVYIQNFETLPLVYVPKLPELTKDWCQQIQTILVPSEVFDSSESSVRFFLHSCSNLKRLDLFLSSKVEEFGLELEALHLLGHLERGTLKSSNPTLVPIVETLVRMYGGKHYHARSQTLLKRRTRDLQLLVGRVFKLLSMSPNPRVLVWGVFPELRIFYVSRQGLTETRQVEKGN